MHIPRQREAMLRLAEDVCRKVMGGAAYPLGLNEISVDEHGYGWMSILCGSAGGYSRKVVVLVKEWRPAVMYLENR